MAFLDVGDGKTYSTIPNAIAAIPATITEDYIIRLYTLTGGYAYTASVTIGGINNANGAYKIIVIGMVGSVSEGGQISVTFTGSNLGFNVTQSYGTTIQNLEINAGVGGRGVQANSVANVIECRITGGTYGTVQGCIYRCVVDGSQYPFYASWIVVNSIAKATSSCLMQPKGPVYTSSLYSNGICINTTGALYPTLVSDSIVVGGTYATGSSLITTIQRYNCAVNSIFYSEANPTEIAQGITTIDGGMAIHHNSFIEDPKFAKTGNIFEWLTPTSTSKALPINQTLIPNGIYANKNRTPVFIGAYTDYIAPDFPSPANVLTTDTVDGVQGTYNGASANDVRLNTPIGQTNGNMVLPVQPDVRNLVGYGSNGTELIGSLEVGASPVASVLALVSVGDGVVTLSVDSDTETLKTYIRYRSGMNDWSAFSETFAITGSGNIAITPLGNGVRYEFIGIVDDNGVYSLPSNSVMATPSSGCEPARINGIADEIVAILDSANLCQGVTPERVYIHNERMAKITSTQIWVQPSANEIISDSRGTDRNNYTIDIGVFAKCITTAETDAVMDVAHAVYLIMRRQEFIDGAKVYQVEMPTLFSPDYLQQNNLFAAVVSVMVADRIP
jgi:hypothetical protein